jgi:hypothetical protein
MKASSNRIGLHYFPDTLHYREADIQFWLPRLTEMGIGWLVVEATDSCAIPESFLAALVGAHIQPLVHLRLPLDPLPDFSGITPLLEAYSRWGVRRIILFDRPNTRQGWPMASWAQQDLVERFLDRYLIIAQLALSAGLQPVLPPLEPGGSYWDTAFLRTTLQTLQRRKQEHLLNELGVAAYAWNSGHGLDWGAGGPERWPAAKPYQTPEGSQDQRGFRIADWYHAIANAVLQHPLPLFLLQADRSDDCSSDQQAAHAFAITRLLTGEEVPDPDDSANSLDPIPDSVEMSAFWLLGASTDGLYEKQAWYDLDGTPRPAALALTELNFAHLRSISPTIPQSKSIPGHHPIEHYLLLPQVSQGLSDWHLDAIRPFLRRRQPTLGFSPSEALLARNVTVIGDTVPEETLDHLRQSGCRVERINGDGMTLATTLAER